MASYASQTTVAAERSRSEIERNLERFGADQFLYGWDEGRAVVQFRAQERLIRFLIDLPNKDDPKFKRTPTGRHRAGTEAAEKAWLQEKRSIWRALSLVIKAKLVAVDEGIVTFENEFLAHVVLPSGETVGDWITPQIASTYEAGNMPPALPIGKP